MRPQSRMGLVENVYKLKNTDEATFHSPIDARATPASTSKLLEEREFVVDSGASMHKLSKKDLSSDELETLRRSRHPAVVVTNEGEMRTIEEAQVYVHDLDLFVTVQLLDDTLAVLSLGKFCIENGYSYEWSKRFKTTADRKWEGIPMTNGKCRTSCCSWIVVKSWCQSVFYISTTGFIIVLLRIQDYSEVTSRHRETGAIQQNPKTKQKRERQSGNGRLFARSS